MAPFINLTPHDIVVRCGAVDTTIPKSGVVARVIGGTTEAAPIAGIPTSIDDVGVVEGVPVPDGASVFVVSGMVLAHPALHGRTDVVAPATGPADGAIRNDKGHIVAVTRLKRPVGGAY